MEKLFVYGTLKVPEVRLRITGKKIPTEKDRIIGYVLQYIQLDEVDYPIIIESSDSHAIIDGEVFEVDETDLQKLDEYEGDAYRRVFTQTESHGMVWVYCK